MGFVVGAVLVLINASWLIYLEALESTTGSIRQTRIIVSAGYSGTRLTTKVPLP